MNNRQMILSAAEFVEYYLKEELSLAKIAGEINYSKFYLEHTFSEAMSISLYDYIKRRRLSEASRELIFSETPILELAMNYGYQSQQAFSSSFKHMYKQSPGRFRKSCQEFILLYPITSRSFADFDSKSYQIFLAKKHQIKGILELMKQTVGAFPYWNEAGFAEDLRGYIREKCCLVAVSGRSIAAVVLVNQRENMIDCFAVHPFLQSLELEKCLLKQVLELLGEPGKVFTTSFREEDKIDIGHRRRLLRLGFHPRQELVEFGYPTQMMELEV